MRLETTIDPHSGSEKVCETIAATLGEFRSHCDASGVTIETDIEDCQATADRQFVRAVATGLITNALGAMPRGGELSVTLIDTAHQWELEVADSGPNPSRLSQPKQGGDPDQIPHLIEFPATEALRNVIRLAHQNQANVESFLCPLGGTAWVMVVPKLQFDSKPETRAA